MFEGYYQKIDTVKKSYCQRNRRYQYSTSECDTTHGPKNQISGAKSDEVVCA